MLESKSKISSGLFKFRKEKACFILNVSPFMESKKVFEIAKNIWIPGFVAPEHYFIGEEIGIKRDWIIETISENEIISDFELFDEWTEKYHYIIELGQKLSPLDDKYKLEENREKLLEEVSPKPFVSSGSNKNMYNPIRGIQYKNRTNSE